MAPVVAEIALAYKDTFIVAKLNAINNPETSRKYLVKGHPTYIVFQNGKDLGRFGETPKAEFIRKVLDLIDVAEN